MIINLVVIFQCTDNPAVEVFFVGGSFFDNGNVVGYFGDRKSRLKITEIQRIEFLECLFTNYTINFSADNRLHHLNAFIYSGIYRKIKD